ncbi:MAG TPA: hypothetical protein EYP06_06885 [Desulfobacterales bacterium]|nr:hypothetical protein [Desulfobacterales bacterium]
MYSRWLGPRSFITVLTVFGVLLLFSLGSTAWAEKEKDREKKDLPARAFTLFPEYPGVVIPQGEESINVDLYVKNKGRSDEDVFLRVTSLPEGWKAWIKTYSYGVRGVHVESEKSRTLTLKIEPSKDPKPGNYEIEILGESRDRKLKSHTSIIVTVKGEEEADQDKGVKILTSYPVLKGPTDATFEFSIEVENNLDKEVIFNLSAQGPKNWEVNFKPAYEEKYISSLRLKEDQSQSVAVEVKPFPLAEPGQYPIVVKVSSPEAKDEAKLTIVLTGTYKMELGTADGLLSLRAQRGKEANISFYVKNNGSATLTNVEFLSFKPENWEVKFSPEKLDSVAPGELKQVEVTIKPAEQALVGDYSVTLNVDAGKVSKNLELRVTVRASTAWGWIGIGIIVLVVLGLVLMFAKLGRR